MPARLPRLAGAIPSSANPTSSPGAWPRFVIDSNFRKIRSYFYSYLYYIAFAFYLNFGPRFCLE
jgi:hypothetical protein